MSDFWARRKAAVEAEAQAEEAAFEAARQAEIDALQAEKSDDELLTDLDLPDPDTLNDPEPLRAFLNDAVPTRLRNRALRRMWRLNPVLAGLDGLVDYGEDFTDAATVVENLQTTYQVGKGMLAHLEELARRAEEQLADEDGEDALSADAVPDEDSAPEPDVVAVAEEAADAQAGLTQMDKAMTSAPAYDDVDHVQAVPSGARRMRFSFEDTAL